MKIEIVENMKNISTKKQERLEKKKKKLAALAEMIKLNDKDRHIKDQNLSISSRSSLSNSDNESVNKYDKSIDKIPKRNEISDSNVDEPKTKKVKIDVLTEEKKYDVQDELPESTSIIANTDNAEMSDEQYMIVKRNINKRKHVPQFRLKEPGELASLSVDHDNRTPIFLTDIQHLLLGALIGSETGSLPTRWCTVEKLSKLTHTVVLIVEGISLFHYLSYQNHFEETNKIFEHKLEVILPTFEEGNILRELATVPLTAAQKDQLIEKYGSLETAIQMNKDPTFMVKEVFSIAKSSIESGKLDLKEKNNDKFPRTKLLLSALQMVDEGYPLPLRGELAKKYKRYKFTKTKYTNVNENSPLFGVDCEMCRTNAGVNELTRISIVDENLISVYESLVRPKNMIIDYLTKYSGITAEMMLTVTKQLHEVQKEVSELLPPDAILVGQSLHSDLHAMQMMHPYVIDTSVIFNLSGDRRRKSKLQVLAKEFLGELIQDRVEGHDSTEDSIASLKLTKLKLTNGLDFGDILLMRKKEQNKAKKLNITNNFFACVAQEEKSAAIVTAQEIPKELKNELDGNYKINSGDTDTHSLKKPVNYYKMDGNKSAINKTREIIFDNALTICNVNLAPQNLELSKIEKSIEKVDKWVTKLHECVSPNGLFILMIGGSPGSTSGVAMVKVKKKSIGSISETSITV